MEDTSELINTHCTDPFSLVMGHGYPNAGAERCWQPSQCQSQLDFGILLQLTQALSMVDLGRAPFACWVRRRQFDLGLGWWKIALVDTLIWFLALEV